MKNNSIKTVVATGIGAALFIIIGTLVNIPTPIPNTNLQLQYAVVALFAVVYGPTVGFFFWLYRTCFERRSSIWFTMVDMGPCEWFDWSSYRTCG